MATVHLAEIGDSLVAVKQLKDDLADDEVYRGMFVDEARLATRLRHRHIVRTHELARDGDRWLMVMELLEGASLQQIRSKLGLDAMPLALGVRVLVAALDALHHAHELRGDDGRPLGVVHRDVSANNVFVTFDGDVKVIDFGVAKSAAQRAVTKIGVVKGSVPYMAPDHVDGGTIDRRADVFAVGVLLREMLTGARLWGEADDLSIVRRLIARELPAFPAGVAAPPRLRAIVDRATRPLRDERYGTALEMKAALEAWLREAAPRVTLEALGAWMRSELAAERTATASRRKQAGAVWLPSSDLRTRLFAKPPPLPRERRWKRAALALALVALGAVLGAIVDDAHEARENAAVTQTE
ncbi:MAG: serine/threonine protein kinase [Labilithrix sp.]|nr:serine/threonine protein kinase [Labilithrix sp.]